MKITIQPMRMYHGKCIPAAFSNAQMYDLVSHKTGKHIARYYQLAEARAKAALLDSTRGRRDANSRLGARWDSVRDEVAARQPKVITRSLTESEYRSLFPD